LDLMISEVFSNLDDSVTILCLWDALNYLARGPIKSKHGHEG